MRKLTPTQIDILRKVYESSEPLVLTGNFRRTAEVLTRKGLVKFEYLPEKKLSRVPTKIRVEKKASPQKVAKVLEEYLEEQGP